jgi:hypothetical protein
LGLRLLIGQMVGDIGTGADPSGQIAFGLQQLEGGGDAVARNAEILGQAPGRRQALAHPAGQDRLAQRQIEPPIERNRRILIEAGGKKIGKNGLFQAMRDGAEAAVAVTLIDGWVLARSAFHHSVNYRSVMAVGKFEEVTDPEAQMAAYQAMFDKIHPGRWDEVRWPSEIELKQTAVMAMELVEVSAKVRTGMPVDDAEDYDLPVWAGVVPLTLERGEPIVDTTPRPET